MKKILLSVFIFFLKTVALASVSIHHDFIESSSQNKVEYFWAYPSTPGPFPLLMLIHPEQESPKTGGKSFVDNGQIEFWVKKGFLTVAISQPGYGGSTGSADFCGPRTQQAVIDLLKNFINRKDLTENRIFLYGGSRGAVVASGVASQFPGLSGVVLKSGVYDFVSWAQERPWYDLIKLRMAWEIGWLSSAKLEERSAIYKAEKIKVPILLIHGTKDSRAPIAHAEKFVEKIISHGGFVEFKKIDSEHIIPMDQITDMMSHFLSSH